MIPNTIPRLIRRLGQSLAATDLAAVPDADLLARVRAARDPVVFEAIVCRHGPRVLAACRKVLPDEADVEDGAGRAEKGGAGEKAVKTTGGRRT